jgi:hypothetical protein
MASALLASLPRKAISTFRTDLMEMLRIGKELDRYYVSSNQDAKQYLEKFDGLIGHFNDKYKHLILGIRTGTESIDLKLFLDEQSVQAVYEKAASKISGLQSAGKSRAAVSVADPPAFEQAVKKGTELFLGYADPLAGRSTLSLAYNETYKKVELRFSYDDIINESGAEFQVAAFYALHDGYDETIDLCGKATEFGFSEWPHHTSKREYFEQFDPHFGE